MNAISKLAATFITGAATLVCFGASANNGIERYTLELYNPAFYVACLNEYVEITATVSGSYHAFDTASGKFRLFEKWDTEMEITGLSSQLMWFGRSSWAETRKIGPGMTNQWTENWIALPVTRDGPKLRMHLRFKVTVNANGELVVNRDDYDWSQMDYFLECIGKPQ